MNHVVWGGAAGMSCMEYVRGGRDEPFGVCGGGRDELYGVCGGGRDEPVGVCEGAGINLEYVGDG